MPSERRVKEEGLPPDEIKAMRRKEAYPLIREFERWVERQTGNSTPQSALGKAVRYAYALYPRMARYVMDGRYRIDNNGAENAVRPLAIGAQELSFLPQPRGGTPYGHRLLLIGNMPTVGYRSRKVAYRCILTHSGLLGKTSGGTPAPHVDTAGAESPFLRFKLPKGSEKIGGGMAGNDISRFGPAIARRTNRLCLPPPSCNESRHFFPIREFS